MCRRTWYRRLRSGDADFYCGVALSPGDPAVLDIWEAAVRSMIESYPEADRYWVVSGSELLGGTQPVHGIAANDPQIQALDPRLPPACARCFRRSRRPPSTSVCPTSIWPTSPRPTSSCAGSKPVYPAAKLGVELIFRGGQLRALDSALPKDVSLMNMVNFTGETAMSYFDGIQGRDLVVWPRITDDGCELNIQLNAMMYDQRRDHFRRRSVRADRRAGAIEQGARRGAERPVYRRRRLEPGHPLPVVLRTLPRPSVRPGCAGCAPESIPAARGKREDAGLAWQARAVQHLGCQQPDGRRAETASTTRRSR